MSSCAMDRCWQTMVSVWSSCGSNQKGRSLSVLRKTYMGALLVLGLGSLLEVGAGYVKSESLCMWFAFFGTSKQCSDLQPCKQRVQESVGCRKPLRPPLKMVEHGSRQIIQWDGYFKTKPEGPNLIYGFHEINMTRSFQPRWPARSGKEIVLSHIPNNHSPNCSVAFCSTAKSLTFSGF